MIHARNDGTCVWVIAAGDPAKRESDHINSWAYLPQMVRSFADGVTADGGTGITGNPLTRVTIHNYLHTADGAPAGQHSNQLTVGNNVYNDLTVDGTKLTYFDEVYADKPDGYNEANPSEEDQAGLYAYGINLEYSTAESWGGTFISWLNACGAAKAAANSN